jgi:hypothetical protein
VLALALVAAGVVVAMGVGRHGRSPRGSAEARRGGRQRVASRALPPPPPDVRGSAARRMRVPILMYHVIGRLQPGAPYPSLTVSPAAFRATCPETKISCPVGTFTPAEKIPAGVASLSLRTIVFCTTPPSRHGRTYGNEEHDTE